MPGSTGNATTTKTPPCITFSFKHVRHKVGRFNIKNSRGQYWSKVMEKWSQISCKTWSDIGELRDLVDTINPKTSQFESVAKGFSKDIQDSHWYEIRVARPWRVFGFELTGVFYVVIYDTKHGVKCWGDTLIRPCSGTPWLRLSEYVMLQGEINSAGIRERRR